MRTARDIGVPQAQLLEQTPEQGFRNEDPRTGRTGPDSPRSPILGRTFDLVGGGLLLVGLEQAAGTTVFRPRHKPLRLQNRKEFSDRLGQPAA